MKRRAKIAVGAGIAFTHFGSYLVFISAVVANDSVGDSNSPFLAAVTPVLGFPLMKTSGTLRYSLHAIGFSDGGVFAGEVGLAALNSVLWASLILLGVGLASKSTRKPIQPPQTTTGSSAPDRV
jgi:hypothetical protein